MAETKRGRWFPQMPPHLPSENADAYTDRLTGADRTGRVPYDYDRNRQCSIGFHDECSERGKTDPAEGSCRCPCHTETGPLELRVWELEETAVALWAVAAGRLPEPGSRRPGWDKRIVAGETDRVAEITARRPELAEWYVKPEAGQ